MYNVGENPKEIAMKVLEGTKYVEIQCAIPAKIKLAGCDKFGIRPCCFKETCNPSRVTSRQRPASWRGGRADGTAVQR